MKWLNIKMYEITSRCISRTNFNQSGDPEKAADVMIEVAGHAKITFPFIFRVRCLYIS